MSVAVIFSECVVENDGQEDMEAVEIRAVKTSVPVGEKPADKLLVTFGKSYFDFIGGDEVVKPVFQRAVDFVERGIGEFKPDSYLDLVALDFVKQAYNLEPSSTSRV